ncbi:hypothetical protein EMCRGX_G021666 [Ephydatia muelleri]
MCFLRSLSFEGADSQVQVGGGWVLAQVSTQSCGQPKFNPELWSAQSINPELWSAQSINPELWSAQSINPELWSAQSINPELWSQRSTQLWPKVSTQNCGQSKVNPEMWSALGNEEDGLFFWAKNDILNHMNAA